MKLFVILANIHAHNGQQIEYKGMTIAENAEEAIKPYGGSSNLDAVPINELDGYDIKLIPKQPEPLDEGVTTSVFISKEEWESGRPLRIPVNTKIMKPQESLNDITTVYDEKLANNIRDSGIKIIDQAREEMKDFKIDNTDLE
jgi:hypothetical protein